jgi:hypothetical protein
VADTITIEQVATAIGAPKPIATMTKDWSEKRIALWGALYACEEVTETLELADGTHRRRRRTLSMPKRVCEDWAALVWTEKSGISAAENEAEFLAEWMGERFTSDFASFLEGDVFARGFGAIEQLVEGITVDAAGRAIITPGTTTLSYDLIPADSIIPLAWRRGEVTSAAFVSWGDARADVRIHAATADGWSVTNRAFVLKGGKLSEADLAEGVAESITFPGAPQMFHCVKPAITNNADRRSPFGVSVFANAVDQLEVVDLIYDNLANDFRLGRKAVFMADTMLRRGAKTDAYPMGQPIPPDKDLADLFMVVQDATGEQKQAITEHNPMLRVTENTEALSAALSLLSNAVGMGAERYVYRGETVATATQIISENSELYRNRARHVEQIGAALIEACECALWFGKNLLKLDVDPEAEVTIVTDDSVIEDDTTRITRGLTLVSAGVLSRKKFLMDYMGMTEEEALEELAAMGSEAPTLV